VQYEYNNEFNVLQGGKYFENGRLDFGSPKRAMYDTFYRTIFGPSVSHAFVTYERSDASLSNALSRLCKVRAPERAGFHQQLRLNQAQFIQNLRVQGVVKQIHTLYSPYFSTFTTVDEEAQDHHADPHDKQKLRIQAWLEATLSGERFISKTLLGRSRRRRLPFVSLKIKPEEYAKPDKPPRVIVDLGVAASLVVFRFAEFFKTAQASETLHFNGGTMRFVKSPDPLVMEQAFEELFQPKGRFAAVYFSDDMCFSYWYRGKVYWHNIDISSCDASHTSHLFDMLRECCPDRAQEAVNAAIKQCEAPIRIRSYAHPKRSVVIQPTTAKLYTGSGITTLINNLATFLIAFSFSTGEISPDVLAGRAADAGYIVTGVEPLEQFEDLQFLKHSPCFDETTSWWRSVLNLGVYLRASGACKYNLPGKGPLEPRARSFQKALFQGVYPYLDTPLLSSFRSTFEGAEVTEGATKMVADIMKRKVTASAIEHERVSLSDENLLRRYRLTGADLSELWDFSKASFATESNYPALHKILLKDYTVGLTSVRSPSRFYAGQMFSHRLRR